VLTPVVHSVVDRSVTAQVAVEAGVNLRGSSIGSSMTRIAAELPAIE
jgi:hypothetical protein